MYNIFDCLLTSVMKESEINIWYHKSKKAHMEIIVMLRKVTCRIFILGWAVLIAFPQHEILSSRTPSHAINVSMRLHIVLNFLG